MHQGTSLLESFSQHVATLGSAQLKRLAVVRDAVADWRSLHWSYRTVLRCIIPNVANVSDNLCVQTAKLGQSGEPNGDLTADQ